MADADRACLICCEVTAFKVLGKCNHPICLTCSAKLRDLCEEKFCTVCRETLDKVIGVFQYTTGEYTALLSKCKVHCNKPGIVFEHKDILTAYKDLFAYKCQVCGMKCNTERHLEEHLKTRHGMFFCEICKDNLKVFIKDLAVYSKNQLRQHRVKGDEIDKSMKGHPLCEFCHNRYLDNEVLHMHLRKNHFWCHLCEGQAFYCAYNDLRLHFKKTHYLCERGECLNEQFTNVFKTEIDLQAHVTSRHKAELGKSQHRQMRRVDVAMNFTYSTNRPSSSRQRIRGDLPREQTSDIGNWNEPSSSLRSNTAPVKPQLGNKTKLRQDAQAFVPRTSSTVLPTGQATSNSHVELAGSPTPRRHSPAAAAAASRRNPQSSRRNSPPSRRNSPPSRRNSPPRRKSPSSRRNSPRSRHKSPPSRRNSPPSRRKSPPSRRNSPPSRRKSPPSRRQSPSSRRPNKAKTEPPPKPAPTPPPKPEPKREQKPDPKGEQKSAKSKINKDFPSLCESVSGTSSSRSGPPKIKVPPKEPDVGRPPDDFYNLDDDEEYRKRSRKKKQNFGVPGAPLIRGRGKAPNNGLWANGKPASLLQPGTSRTANRGGAHNSRKQTKTRHEENFGDNDFTWFVEPSRDRSRSNDRSGGKNKKNKESTKKGLNNNRSTPNQTKKETLAVSETKSESQQPPPEPIEVKTQPDSCCIPNNPWGDDDYQESANYPSNPVIKEQSNPKKEQSNSKKEKPKPKKEHSNSKKQQPNSKKATFSKDIKNDLMSELSDIGKTLSLESKKKVEDSESPVIHLPPEPTPVSDGDNMAPPPTLQMIFKSAKQVPSEQNDNQVPTVKDFPPLNDAPETSKEDSEIPVIHLPPEPTPVSDGDNMAPPPTLQMIFKSARKAPSPPSQHNDNQIQKVEDFPPLNDAPGLQQRATPYAPPTAPGNISSVDEYPHLEKPPVSPPTIKPKFKVDYKNFPTLGADDTALQNYTKPTLRNIKQDLQTTHSPRSSPPTLATRSSDTPPGFTPQKAGPPPGLLPGDAPQRFSRMSRPDTVCPPPPGFPGQQQEETAPPPSISDILLKSGNGHNPQGGYIECNNFTNRNREFEEKMSQHIGPSLFPLYQQMYDAMRNKQMDVSAFTRICRKFIAPDKFEEVFEEFVVLQRDIALQNQLHTTLGKPPSLIPCSVCSQILKESDLYEHSGKHNINSSTDLRTQFSHLLRK